MWTSRFPLTSLSPPRAPQSDACDLYPWPRRQLPRGKHAGRPLRCFRTSFPPFALPTCPGTSTLSNPGPDPSAIRCAELRHPSTPFSHHPIGQNFPLALCPVRLGQSEVPNSVHSRGPAACSPHRFNLVESPRQRRGSQKAIYMLSAPLGAPSENSRPSGENAHRTSREAGDFSYSSAQLCVNPPTPPTAVHAIGRDSSCPPTDDASAGASHAHLTATAGLVVLNPIATPGEASEPYCTRTPPLCAPMPLACSRRRR